METTEQTPPPGRGLDGLYAALRRPGVARVSQGRWFAGVAGGIARWLGVDPLVVRAGFILFGLFFGVGLGLYLALVLLLPDEQGTIRLEQALRHGDGKSIFLLVITALVLFGGPWDGDSQGFRIGGFVVIGLVAWWFLTRTGTGQELRRSAPWAGAPASEQPTASAAATSGAPRRRLRVRASRRATPRPTPADRPPPGRRARSVSARRSSASRRPCSSSARRSSSAPWATSWPGSAPCRATRSRSGSPPDSRCSGSVCSSPDSPGAGPVASPPLPSSESSPLSSPRRPRRGSPSRSGRATAPRP